MYLRPFLVQSLSDVWSWTGYFHVRLSDRVLFTMRFGLVENFGVGRAEFAMRRSAIDGAMELTSWELQRNGSF
jgi:hypothetical protein